MDISNFQCHKNANFGNNFVGMMIADENLESLWKYFLIAPPDKGVKYNC